MTEIHFTTAGLKRISRASRGSVLALVCAFMVGVTMLMLFFFLDTSRFMASHGEQTSAIEGAAMAAAHDLGEIVVEDPELGFVGLSDKPPTGKNTVAGDNYFMPVRGINTLTATVRLDMIIADLLNDNTMRACAIRDYDQVMSARVRLFDLLQNAVKTGGFGYDADGNVLHPVIDATNAYEQNVTRIARGKSKLVPGSLKLSLGYIDGLVSNTRVPQPTRFANMPASAEEGLCYKSFVDVPYDGRNFVFAALGDNVTIGDVTAFKSSMPNLPYAVPTIVKCHANQQFDEIDHTGKNLRRVVSASAVAEPANNRDPRPHPGNLTISFPSGSIAEISSLFVLMTNTQISKAPADSTQTPLAGDYAPSPLSNFAIPCLNKERPPFGQVVRVGVYDWIRRAGSTLDVQSLLDSFSQPFSVDSSSHAEVLSVGTNGAVGLTSTAISGETSLPVSNKQWTSVSGLGFQTASGPYYDVFVKDYTSQAGRVKGGLHGGEPLGADPNPPAGSNIPNGSKQISENPATLSHFPYGPAGGAARPTYLTDGIATEIRLRLRQNTPVP